MDIVFLDEDFEEIYLLDSFKSLIWTERYWKTGDFDLACAPSVEILEALTDTKYFELTGVVRDWKRKMRLETINIKTDTEDGDLLIIQGRDLSSILGGRIIWNPTIIDGNLQIGIQGLINDAIISPTDTDREIDNFNFVSSTDPLITALTAETQFQGEFVLDAISQLCIANGIGFRVIWNQTLSAFRFALIVGVNRSFDQTANATVAFTSALDNLINADYVASGRPEKNVCLVAGEAGVGNVRTTVEVGSGSGLDRKEVYLEANITRNTPAGEMTDEEYEDALAGKGLEELAKRPYLVAFDGEVDTVMYAYGTEFSMGDLLQIADDYGHAGKARVTEMIYSQDSEGIKLYPTFETVE